MMNDTSDMSDQRPPITLHTIKTRIFYACMILTSLFGFILYIIFRNKQPLRSRQGFVLVSCLCLFTGHVIGLILHELINFGVFKSFYDIMMVWVSLLMDVNLLIPIAGISLIIVRFLLFQNLSFNQQKYLDKLYGHSNKTVENFNENHSKVLDGIKKNIRIARILLSNKFLVFIVLMIFLVYSCIYLALAVFAAYRFNWVGIARRVCILSMGSLMVTIAFICLLIDIVNHFKEIRVSVYRYMVERDQLFIRRDLLVAMLALFFTVIAFIILALIHDNHDLMYLVMVLDVIRVVSLAFVGCGIGCSLIALSNHVRGKFSSNTQRGGVGGDNHDDIGTKRDKQSEVYFDSEMMECLMDHEGFKLFRHFTESEFSTENIQCWEHIQEFKRMDPEKKHKQLHLMKELFFSHQSVMEVNVTQKAKGNLMESSQDWKSKIDVHILDELEKEIMINLFDSFTRLKFTSSYKKFKLALDFKKSQSKLIGIDLHDQ